MSEKLIILHCFHSTREEAGAIACPDFIDNESNTVPLRLMEWHFF
jgi:hypothetical protein